MGVEAMNTVERISDESGHDKVTEKRMAELLGTTPKALQRKRERNIIPPSVWSKIDGRIMYSKWRYDEWLESQWSCPPELSLSGSQSGSGSPGTKSATARRSLSRKPQKELQQPKLYVLK